MNKSATYSPENIMKNPLDKQNTNTRVTAASNKGCVGGGVGGVGRSFTQQQPLAAEKVLKVGKVGEM